LERIDGTRLVQDPEPPEPAAEEGTLDVTRYLAAAAYLDEEFRDDVIRLTLRETYRFIAPSYGVEVGCVARHCLASRRLSRRRDVILSALLVVGLWALHLPFLFEVAVFVGALLVAIALSRPIRKLRWRIVLTVIAYVGIAAFVRHPLSLLTALAALFVVAADWYERRYRVVARRMADAKKFDPKAPAYGRERDEDRAADEARVAHLVNHRDGNVVVYSGYWPFIGSGFEIDRWAWSVAIDLAQEPDGSRRPGSAPSVGAGEVSAYLIDAINELGLEGCQAAERFYVSGRHVGSDQELYFHSKASHEPFPKLRSTIEDVARLEAKPTELVRRYADIKVESWESELILSAFVRCVRSPDYLSVELTYFVLPPLKAHYHAIGNLHPRPTPHQLLLLVGSSLSRMPLLWLEAPRRVARWMARPVTRARREQVVAQAIRENRKFDYGALGSVRETGSGDDYAKFFQQEDIGRFHNIVDKHLLTSLCAFLEERGVDTSELKRTIRSIINNGVWINGNQTGPVNMNKDGHREGGSDKSAK
jgi:hypothetical protein